MAGSRKGRRETRPERRVGREGERASERGLVAGKARDVGNGRQGDGRAVSLLLWLGLPRLLADAVGEKDAPIAPASARERKGNSPIPVRRVPMMRNGRQSSASPVCACVVPWKSRRCGAMLLQGRAACAIRDTAASSSRASNTLAIRYLRSSYTSKAGRCPSAATMAERRAVPVRLERGGRVATRSRLARASVEEGRLQVIDASTCRKDR